MTSAYITQLVFVFALFCICAYLGYTRFNTIKQFVSTLTPTSALCILLLSVLLIGACASCGSATQLREKFTSNNRANLYPESMWMKHIVKHTVPQYYILRDATTQPIPAINKLLVQYPGGSPVLLPTTMVAGPFAYVLRVWVTATGREALQRNNPFDIKYTKANTNTLMNIASQYRIVEEQNVAYDALPGKRWFLVESSSFRVPSTATNVQWQLNKTNEELHWCGFEIQYTRPTPDFEPTEGLQALYSTFLQGSNIHGHQWHDESGYDAITKFDKIPTKRDKGIVIDKAWHGPLSKLLTKNGNDEQPGNIVDFTISFYYKSPSQIQSTTVQSTTRDHHSSLETSANVDDSASPPHSNTVFEKNRKNQYGIQSSKTKDGVHIPPLTAKQIYEMKIAFRSADNRLTADELVSVMAEADESITHEQANYILALYDANRDNKFDENEFISLSSEGIHANANTNTNTFTLFTIYGTYRNPKRHDNPPNYFLRCEVNPEKGEMYFVQQQETDHSSGVYNEKRLSIPLKNHHNAPVLYTFVVSNSGSKERSARVDVYTNSDIVKSDDSEWLDINYDFKGTDRIVWGHMPTVSDTPQPDIDTGVMYQLSLYNTALTTDQVDILSAYTLRTYYAPQKSKIQIAEYYVPVQVSSAKNDSADDENSNRDETHTEKVSEQKDTDCPAPNWSSNGTTQVACVKYKPNYYQEMTCRYVSPMDVDVKCPKGKNLQDGFHYYPLSNTRCEDATQQLREVEQRARDVGMNWHGGEEVEGFTYRSELSDDAYNLLTPSEKMNILNDMQYLRTCRKLDYNIK